MWEAIKNINLGNPVPATSVGDNCLFMLLQTIILSIIVWYLARVRPGRYGQALPCCFPFKKSYWSKQPAAVNATQEVASEKPEDQMNFEKPPSNLPVSIQVINVSKKFGKDQVLQEVNLTVYRGEITVLLGHNGAGKTTIMNIIAGMISATSGTVLVEGKDNLMQASQIRKLIGVCPQQDVFFPQLTVREHVRVFAMVEALSGGMRRRLQLACAIVGRPRVLILDEPTRGLDVEGRQEIWNLLLSLRGNSTIILTTHLMEEADSLADRIVALQHGRVRCHGTAMFLKRAIGTDYRLTLTTIGAPREAEISAIITGAIPNATVVDRRPNGVSYNLPATDSAKFPALFTTVEAARSYLNIETFGVGKITLDEVFVDLGGDEKISYTEEMTANSTTEPKLEKVTGAKLRLRQMAVLLLRQWHYVFSRIYYMLISILLVIVVIGFLAEVTNNTFDPSVSNSSSALSEEMMDSPQRLALVNVDEHSLTRLRNRFKGVHFVQVPNVSAATIPTDRYKYNECIIGIELNNTTAKALYSPWVRNCAPAALNALSNALGMRDAHDHPQRTFAVSTRLQPLENDILPNLPELLRKSPNESKKDPEFINWAQMFTLVLYFYLYVISLLPMQDRELGARHAHVMAGAPRTLHWCTTLLAHLLLAWLVCLPMVIITIIVEKDSTTNQSGFLGALFMLLLLEMLAFLGLVYLLSVLVSPPVYRFLLVTFCLIFTELLPDTGAYAVLLPPQHVFIKGLTVAAKVATVNAFCNLNREDCPLILSTDPQFDLTKCCESPSGSEPWSYWSTHAAGMHMIILAVQFIVFFVLTVIVDDGMLSRLWKRKYASPPSSFHDAAVSEEAAYVARAITLPKNEISDLVLCHQVKKVYTKCFFFKPFHAVKDISFSVKDGECFGLLGVNGAGTSTTFKMLTGVTNPTDGVIFANGRYCREGSAYMNSLSYCPQSNGVDAFLTGRQNLALMLTLRGLQKSDVNALAPVWLQDVGLSGHAKKRVSSYSGGMRRRLATAAAVCQPARATVLDQPTAGVDPVGRRRMHVVVLRANRTRAFIIASQSLEDIEALCRRVAIMASGEVRALGTAATLKSQPGQGYSVVFQLNPQEVTHATLMLGEFQAQTTTRFKCELQHQYQYTLRYHVKEMLPYSQLFAQLEQLREQFSNLVEDFTLTQITLEEVLLASAKEVRTSESV